MFFPPHTGGNEENSWALAKPTRSILTLQRGTKVLTKRNNINIFLILDTIDLHMKRISSLEKLDFSKFVEYDKTFPDTAFISLKETYACFFYDVLLRRKLKVLYSSPELAKINVSKLTLFMRSTGLCSGTAKLYKLCELFWTVPSTTASIERTCSALKRIKTFQRNATGRQRLSCLALMSIEKRMLHQLKKSDSFFEKVIDEFTKKDWRMNYVQIT